MVIDSNGEVVADDDGDIAATIIVGWVEGLAMMSY